MNSENCITSQATHYAGLVNALAGICVGLAYVLHPYHATPEVSTKQFLVLGTHIICCFTTGLHNRSNQSPYASL